MAMKDSSPAARLLPVAGRTLHLREEGEGPPVLLVHGVPTSALLWSDVAPRLAARARVLAVDLLGYGVSDPPAGLPVDVPAHARYLLELLDALGVERATVVGHDVGGGVAQHLAVHHPERVERLGLVNCVCYDNWPVPEMKAIQATAPVFERLPAGPTAAALRAGLRRGFAHPDRADRFLDAFLEPFSTREGLELLVEHVRAQDSRYTEALAPLLPRLRMPAAVVWGARDPFLEPRWGERLAADVPGAELTLLPEASHFSPADAPREVAEALLRLLERPA